MRRWRGLLSGHMNPENRLYAVINIIVHLGGASFLYPHSPFYTVFLNKAKYLNSRLFEVVPLRLLKREKKITHGKHSFVWVRSFFEAVLLARDA
jgi:hypothetical protein